MSEKCVVTNISVIVLEVFQSFFLLGVWSDVFAENKLLFTFKNVITNLNRNKSCTLYEMMMMTTTFFATHYCEH